MKTIGNYPKVKTVKPLNEKRILVEFENGVFKYYDCNPLLAAKEFHQLKNDAIFKHVKADPHGYGILWNDEIDLAESNYGSME